MELKALILKSTTPLRFILKWIFRCIVFLLILCCLYLSVMRYYLPNLNQYRQDINHTLSFILKQKVEIGSIQGYLQGLTPVISAKDISIDRSQDNTQVIHLDELKIKPFLRKSARFFSPHLEVLRANNLSITLHQTKDHRWSLFGAPQSPSADLDEVVDFISSIKDLYVSDIHLVLNFLDGTQYISQNVSVALERSDQFRRILARVAPAGKSALIDRNSAHPIQVDGERVLLDLILESEGELTSDKLSAQVLLKTKQLNLGVLNALFKNKNIDIDAKGVNLELAGDKKSNNKLKINAKFDIEQLVFNHSNSSIEGLNFSIQWLKDLTKLQQELIYLGDLKFKQSNIQYEVVDKALIQYFQATTTDKQQLNISAEKVNSQGFGVLVTSSGVLSNKINRLLTSLDINGNLINPQLFLQRINTAKTRAIKPAFHNINLNALTKTKAVKNSSMTVPNSTVMANGIAGKHYSQTPSVEWEFSTQLDGVRTKASGGIPGISNLDANLWMNNKHGWIQVADQSNLKLLFNGIYPHRLHLDAVSATVAWDITAAGTHVYSPPISLSYQGGKVNGWFGLDIPFDTSRATQLTLNLGLRNLPASAHRQLVPVLVPSSVRNWLMQSIRGGVIKKGAFLFSGSIGPNKKYKSLADITAPSLQLALDMADVNLKYQPQWPALTKANATLWYEQQQLSADISSAKMINSKVKQAKIDLEPRSKASGSGYELRFDAKLKGDGADIIKTLKESKVSPALSQEMGSWVVKGNADSHIKGALNLGVEKMNPQISVTTMLNNVNFELLKEGFKFSHLSGPISYDTRSGLSSNKAIKASFLGFPTTIKLADKKCRYLAAKLCTVINVSGRVDPQTVAKLSKQPWIKELDGNSSYQAQLEISAKQGVSVVVNSNAIGISSNLPDPFAKPAEQLLPIHYQYQSSAKQQLFDLSIRDKLLLKAKKKSAQSAYDFLVALGDASNQRQTIKNNGYTIVGDIERLDLPQWKNTLSMLQKKYSPNNSELPFTLDTLPDIRIDQLRIDQLLANDRMIKDLTIDVHPQNEGYQATINSKAVSGEAIYRSAQAPVILNFESIDIAEFKTSTIIDQSVPADKNSNFSDIDFSKMPDIKFSVKALTSGQVNYGQWSFNITKDPQYFNSIVVQNINAKFDDVVISSKDKQGAKYVWNPAQGSSFSGRFNIKHVERLMNKLGFEQVIKAEKVRLDTDIHWQGGLLDFGILHSQGYWDFELENGFLLQSPPTATNILKVISIANLTGILSHLRLSIGDLAKEGLQFNSFKGSINSGAGVFEIADPITIKSASSEIVMSGFVNSKTEQINAELVVTIPIRGNLPWVVALAAGFPVAAGVFVAGTLFKGTVDDLSSLVYDIRGSVNDPTVKFKRLFNIGKKKDKEKHSEIEKQTQIDQDKNRKRDSNDQQLDGILNTEQHSSSTVAQ